MKRKMLVPAVVTLLHAQGLYAASFEQVFNEQRALYGKGHEFSYGGKIHTTFHPEEIEAMAEPNAANARALIDGAEALRVESAAVGYEWRGPAIYIRQAREALAAGRYQSAMELAARAKYQARMSLKQYRNAEANWQRAVPE